ncbi:MAG: hypothetical protein ACPLIG_07810 [Candidatus Bathyarchaeales archaeon]
MTWYFDYVGVNYVAEGLQRLRTGQIKEKRETRLPQSKTAICCFHVRSLLSPSITMSGSVACAGFAGALGAKLKERYRRREEWQSAAADKPYSQSPLSPPRLDSQITQKGGN